MVDAEQQDATRAMWSTGDYPRIATVLRPGALELVGAAGVRPGQRVLDVGTGSGNVAIAAARAGAEVVGVDLTDAWFDAAHDRADESGVEVTLQLGDAQELAFEDDAFDVVLSCFAAVFAPDHEAVARELARVCRPGGTVGITAWDADAAISAAEALRPHLAAIGIEPPVSEGDAWGTPGVAVARLAAVGVEATASNRVLPVVFDDVEAFEEWLFTASGPFIQARDALEAAGSWGPAAADLRVALEEADEGSEGTFVQSWPYVVAVGTLTAR